METFNRTSYSSTITTDDYHGDVVCLYNANSVARAVGIVLSSFSIMENIFLLIAIVAYWPKFLSNLYRFVAALLCADIFVGCADVFEKVLRYYKPSLNIIAFAKGTFITSYLTSVFSVVFVNLSVFLTYSRFTNTLLEHQRLHAENTLQRATRMRRYFRKPSVAYIVIGICWLMMITMICTSVFTSCQSGECETGCSTVLADASGTEIPICRCYYCSKFLAPLSIYYVIAVLTLAWFGFLALIVSTLIAVCLKVVVKPVYSELPLHNTAYQDDYLRNNKQSQRELNSSVSVISTANYDADDASDTTTFVNYEIRRTIGFNQDFMSRFSLLITSMQIIFWVPVTGMVLYTYVADATFGSFIHYEYLTTILFFIPLAANPIICVLTLSRLREAIFNTYFKKCN